MFERPHLQVLIRRIQEERKFIQVLTGPRQVGKTTLVTQLVKKMALPDLFESADAIPSANTTWIEQIWETARLKMQQANSPAFLLVIDEIQKIDNWSEVVKRLWDEDTRKAVNIKVILLGSSRLLMQRGLSESLAGRFESTYLGHWSFPEMQAAFGWSADQYAWFGGYPGSATLIEDEERWKQYISHSLIETSISKDILMLTRVDKPALLKRLFEIGCLYSGQILSYTKMQGQLQDAGNTTTLSHYLDLLNTAGLLGGIEAYAADIVRKRASSPKFQVHNTALISAQRAELFREIRGDATMWGRIVESSAGAHLVNHALTENFNVHYWRHRDAEVDFVIEKRGKVIGIEIKSGGDVATSGMEQFKKQFHPHKILLVGKAGLPWEEFLSINPASLF
ncbi:ATP-binding protein [Asinibacterium sp. OR53]|uniref:ATP-binding protein n=1 Tax=Asinibacterium sp. OR53 TaxID=925409 RepID=UPI00047B41F2|nr:ATP-binding protein [Asinibacterium sp. OR53]